MFDEPVHLSEDVLGPALLSRLKQLQDAHAVEVVQVCQNIHTHTRTQPYQRKAIEKRARNLMSFVETTQGELVPASLERGTYTSP